MKTWLCIKPFDQTKITKKICFGCTYIVIWLCVLKIRSIQAFSDSSLLFLPESLFLLFGNSVYLFTFHGVVKIVFYFLYFSPEKKNPRYLAGIPPSHHHLPYPLPGPGSLHCLKCFFLIFVCELCLQSSSLSSDIISLLKPPANPLACLSHFLCMLSEHAAPAWLMVPGAMNCTSVPHSTPCLTLCTWPETLVLQESD